MTGHEDDDVTMPVQKPAASPTRLGRYELEDRLGKGGMGVVYRARDTRLDRPVAVKLLVTDLEGDSETRERFLREARAAGELNHRNIIKVYDFGEEGGRAFLVMELLEGDILNDFLKAHPDLSLDRKLQIMTGVCEGLAFSHSRSIVHRDLKPGNLFITRDREVKILDFGLARVASSKLTRSGLVFGTPDYMSPEQVRGKVVDERSDIFSLGAVFYQVLSGRKPFAAKSLPEVMRKVLTEEPPPLSGAGVPPSLARIVERALRKEPLKRYQRVTELLADLRGIDPDEPAAAEAVSGEPSQIDRYQIIERVGRGGMGVVYRARDPVLDRDVAIKSMLVDFGEDREARGRFQQEARSAARLQHPNIVTIYEFGEQQDSPYLVMEFLGGDDLETLLTRDRPLGLVERLDILAQLCEGLAFAHGQGVVHRDIKPGNVRLLEDGTVKLLDFGIAKVPKKEASAGTVAGTVAYASPEQLAGEPVDFRSDLFSVGVLAYELLTGKLPFSGGSPAAVAYQVVHEAPPPLRAAAPGLPVPLETLVSQTLSKTPADRPDSALALAEGFRAIAREVAAAETVTRPTPGRRRGGHRVVAGELPGGGPEPTVPGLGERSIERTPTPEPPPPPPRPPALWVGAAVVALLVGAGYVGYRQGLIPVPGGDPASGDVTPAGVTPAAGQAASVAGTDAGQGPAADAAGVPASPPLVLEVDSNPSGAAVSLDGEDTGEVTPASFPLAEPYPTTVALDLDGYEPFEEALPDVADESIAVAFELTPEPTYGRVVLTGAYPFEVWGVQRQLREAATEHDLTLETGGRILRMRNDEYFLDRRFDVAVVENEAERLVAPTLGTLRLFTRPGNCRLLVDGRDFGYPPVGAVDIAPGTYAVSRACDDPGQDLEREVTVVSDQDARVEFDPVTR